MANRTLQTYQRHSDYRNLMDCRPDSIYLLWAHDYLIDESERLSTLLRESDGAPVTPERIKSLYAESNLAWVIDKLLDAGQGYTSQRFGDLAKSLIEEKAKVEKGELWQQQDIELLARSIARWCLERVWAMPELNSETVTSQSKQDNDSTVLSRSLGVIKVNDKQWITSDGIAEQTGDKPNSIKARLAEHIRALGDESDIESSEHGYRAKG